MVERKSTATRGDGPSVVKDGPGTKGTSKSGPHERASVSPARASAGRSGSRAHAAALESDAADESNAPLRASSSPARANASGSRANASGSRANASSSRASASGSRSVAKVSRSADSISAEIVDQAVAPIDAATLLGGNSLLFLVAAICASAFTATELLTGHYAQLGSGLVWLIACAALA